MEPSDHRKGSTRQRLKAPNILSVPRLMIGESFNDGDYFLYLNVTDQRVRGFAGSKNWMSSIG